LGTGIGKDDFDVAKLRYHKLIIMCDADVDGSHIRTLILTFFFRQMRELIDRGYLYIAQPPLYKVSHGKKEVYLKDDDEYRTYLLERIQDDWRLRLGDDGAGNGAGGAGGEELSGTRLTRFVRRLEDFRAHMARLASRGYPERALALALAHGLRAKDDLEDAAKLERLAAALAEAGFREVAVGRDEEHGTGAVSFVSRRDGVERPVRLDWNLIAAGEYRALAANREGLGAVAAGTLTLANGGETSEHRTIEEALDTLYAGAKKGLAIQRYKGLGEMNPGQLWETTMDPARRRLLQVRIEDAGEADQIFTTLMGDLVEPRREFIERNALEVKNLDI
jgi:DNA gyrase subunit B